MPTMLKAVSDLLCLFAVAVLANDSSAAQQLPGSVMLSDGAKVTISDGKAIVAAPGDKRNLKLSLSFQRALQTSTDIVFPESSSRRLDGHDVILVVLKFASSSWPLSYCGAGTEDELYVLEKDGRTAKIGLSTKVSSCLDNIELEDNGADSPYASIRWVGTPASVSVSWARDWEGAKRTRLYKMTNGHFVESDN
ncbi:hypothetical protein P9239_11645 [Caballeronia sp. LZ062]|uniref:hypothetical protein n=1 Tax=unclassified Caballeronia TaxID=2646786 RepID=UPI00285DC95B|nr:MULTISPECIES: hypothetical protein [unclassified Caballeronia]MDR5854471.1 hypothetical protein [Caballeronia sp. LZ050]MDR5870999.1 hypothetical protein [Caballeronia sp. LZ062]